MLSESESDGHSDTSLVSWLNARRGSIGELRQRNASKTADIGGKGGATSCEIVVDRRPVRAYLEQLEADAGVEREGPAHKPPKVISETDPQAAWSTKDGPGRFS